MLFWVNNGGVMKDSLEFSRSWDPDIATFPIPDPSLLMLDPDIFCLRAIRFLNLLQTNTQWQCRK